MRSRARRRVEGGLVGWGDERGMGGAGGSVRSVRVRSVTEGWVRREEARVRPMKPLAPVMRTDMVELYKVDDGQVLKGSPRC